MQTADAASERAAQPPASEHPPHLTAASGTGEGMATAATAPEPAAQSSLGVRLPAGDRGLSAQGTDPGTPMGAVVPGPVAQAAPGASLADGDSGPSARGMEPAHLAAEAGTPAEAAVHGPIALVSPSGHSTAGDDGSFTPGAESARLADPGTAPGDAASLQGREGGVRFPITESAPGPGQPQLPGGAPEAPGTPGPTQDVSSLPPARDAEDWTVSGVSAPQFGPAGLPASGLPGGWSGAAEAGASAYGGSGAADLPGSGTPGPAPTPAPRSDPAAASVPRQKDGTGRARVGGAGPLGPEPAALPDLLDHPDPAVAAEAAAVENLLRCWVRETGIGRPDGPVGTLLRIPLPASGAALLVAVRYWSPSGWHRFSPPRFEAAPAYAPALDAVTLAALIAREGNPAGRGGADLVGRVADSVHRTAEFIADRREHPAPPAPVAGDLFLTSEQSLLLGHPLHPTPKSREGLSEAEVRPYSPELHGSFPLHWLAVAPAALATDSAWTERGRPVPAAQLLGRLAPGLTLPDGATPLPLHPWQARDLLRRPAVTALRDAGLLTDLGPHGEPWHPTSSIRTVHRPGAPAMLKLSLGLRITNSRRENLRKELHRGVEVHRLLRTGLAEQWQAAHPGFDIVRDPAWVAVNAPDGTPVQGLDVLLRHNPFRSGDDALCVAALTAPRPWPGRTTMRSRLAEIVSRLAGATGRSTSAVSAEWFLRYLDHVVLPVLAFDALAGVALEAHQQNTLVILDPAGWPLGGRYRDNQGYYFRASRRAELERRLPGIGAASDTFVSDAITDERFAYYLGVNNVLGLIGAFGSARLADERVLLAAFRRFLGKAAGLGPLPAQLLDSPTLRCKANLLTRLGGLDELVGPVDTQSVYVTIANPLHD
ncbi:N(2)-citryl-N(6)-acetyl-N(6)-hydroxylysine synthase [Streptomyces sp. ADI91-18]|nr:N(2)-citryl-N(6)-acetyl-N(6)-hydroxylysine synthase [Streptomyces sp. ADI91-18]